MNNVRVVSFCLLGLLSFSVCAEVVSEVAEKIENVPEVVKAPENVVKGEDASVAQEVSAEKAPVAESATHESAVKSDVAEATSTEPVAEVVQEAAPVQQDTITIPDGPILLDRIEVALYGIDATDIVTKSEIDRPSLSGQKRSRDDIVFERLVFMDAKKFKVEPDEDAIDRHLKTVQRENNLTIDELKNVFTSAGYTYEEGRQEFGKMTAVNSMFDFKVNSRLIIKEKDVMAYYEENPEWLEAEYFLERGMVAVASNDERDDIETRLRAYTLGRGTFAGIAWAPPFWINDSEISQDNAFVRDMNIGSLSEPRWQSAGFELFRLKDKKPRRQKPLDDRYNEIANLLRRPLYEQLFDDYKKELFDKTSIVYFGA